MPKLGLTMDEGTIIRWLKLPGSEVARGEAIAEIETDKATAVIEAETSGTLGPILVPEGTSVPVGKVIACLVAPGEEAPRPGPPAPLAVPNDGVVSEHRAPAPVPQLERGAVPASPRARRLADELRVELSTVVGSGPHGRIIEEDVRRAAERLSQTPREAEAPTPAASGQAKPLRGMRKAAAERMVHSFTTAPHFYLSVEVDASLLLKRRESLLPRIAEQSGVRLTVSDLLIKIAAQALQECPEASAVWADGGVRRLDTINVGLAVATDRGLVVPVLDEVNHKSLREIAVRRHALTEKARAGRLTMQDLEGGGFTISNLGMFAVDRFSAIINPPQAAILAVGRIKERPFVTNGQLTVRPTMCLTLSVDHRILDGAEAARFLGRLVALVEEPSRTDSTGDS
jgi:pyruvate dehydrogenase E2 component (dihydrolipoamide acetyltransferase)